MSVSSRIALAALRSLWSECRAARPAKKLKDGLDDKVALKFTAVSSGAIQSTSGSGRSVTFFSTATSNDPSAADLVECYIYLRELYDRALTALGGSPTDAAIETQMETYLRPLSGYQNDWRMLQR